VTAAPVGDPPDGTKTELWVDIDTGVGGPVPIA